MSVKIDILKHQTPDKISGDLTKIIYFRDIFDASFNTLSGQNKTIDISGTTTNTHKISVSNNFLSPHCIDLSKVNINGEYVIDISSGYVKSEPFKINRPTFNNLDISYNDFKIDENNQIVNQGDKQVTVKWDYSGNINVYELELSCNKIPVPVNKRTLTSENFKGGNDYNNIFSYTDIKKKQEFTWDISFNDISGNNDFNFGTDFFKIILKDKDPSNNIITDSSAVYISSTKFNIIAPQLKNFKIQNENSININTTKIATQGRHVKIIWENDQTGKPDLCGNIYDLIIELSNNTITIPNDNINIVNNIPSSDLSYNWFIPFDNDISGSNYKIILKACNSHSGNQQCNILNHVKPIESTTFDISYINPIHITYTNASNQKETLDLSPLNIRKDNTKWFRGIPSIPNLLYIMDEIDISWNETTPLGVGDKVTIDISGLDVDYSKNILTHTVNDHTDYIHFPNGVFKKTLDLSLNGYDDSKSYFNNHYMFVISKSYNQNTIDIHRPETKFFSPPFKINRPVFNNINYKIQRNPNSTPETFDISNQEIAQGDRITINWDYSGNITDVDLELSSNVIDIQNKPFSHLLENYDDEAVTYSNGVGTFTWDVSYNEISGNNFDSDFPDNKYFKIILKDKSDKNAYYIKDCSAVDISSSKFNIIAPRLGKVTLKDENNIDVETTKKVKQGKNVQIEWDYSGNINSVQLELSNNTIKKCIYNIVGIDNVANTFTLDNVDDTSPITFKSNSTLQFENIKPDLQYNISIIDQTNKTIKLYELTDTENNTPLSLDVSYNVMDISFNQDSLTLNTVENLSIDDKVKLFFDGNDTFSAGNQRNTTTALIKEKEYEIAQMDDNKIRLKEIGEIGSNWIDISTNDLTSFVTRKGQSNMGDFNIHLKKEFTNDFPVNNFTLEKDCGKLYGLKNLTIFPSIVNDGKFTYTVPVNKDLSGSSFKIVLNPLIGGFKNIDISGVTTNSLLDYEFDISHNKFFKIEVFGDDTNESVSFKYNINNIVETNFTLESIYGLNIGDEIVFNNQRNSIISSDTVNNLEPLKTYKIKTIVGKDITIVPGNTVNVNDVDVIDTGLVENTNFNSMFEKKINGNNFLLFYKRKNILRFNISREALKGGYVFKLVGPLPNGTEENGKILTNFGACDSIKVNLYILEIQINWIFEEKANNNQNFDITEGDYYLLLTSKNSDKNYDISSNIFKIKYFDDCKNFPFGRFNNSKSNLKIYPFLDNANTIQGRNPIFSSSVQIKKSSRMSYISKNRYVDR